MPLDLVTTEKKKCKYCGTLSYSVYCCHACEMLDSGFSELNSRAAKIESQFSYLDLPETQALYQHDAEDRSFRLFIHGIQCSSCVHLLEQIQDMNAHCKLSRLNISNSELIIKLDAEGKLSDIASLIKAMGYEFTAIKATENSEETNRLETRQELKRIALAGALAGNIMLFSIAIYTGATGTLLTVFKWLNLALFLPILFYVAIPFYRGAFASLKMQKIHIDLPIVIALLTSSGLSIYSLLSGGDQFYFDSTASFIFLILVARFFVKKAQHRFLSPQNLHSHFRNDSYSLSDNSSTVVTENIKPGQKITISQDQAIPVDGILVSDRALIDTSFMSGENIPYTFTKGMRLFAGYKLLSASILMVCEKSSNQTRISELLSKSQENLLSKNSYLSLVDRLSEKLILYVFILAAFVFVGFGLFINFTESFHRALALIVVACPCALAFGSPLTMAMAFRKSQKKGISVRNANVFEKLNHIQNIFFDKTGTLTYGQLQVFETWPEKLTAETVDVLIGLEKISYHPVAFALRSHFKQANSELSFNEHQEIFGSGIKGRINSDHYELRTLSSNLYDDGVDIAIALYKNKEVVCRIYLQDKIREEAKTIINQLRSLGKSCFLLSGDKKRKAMAIGEECGVSREHIFFELYPEDKKDIIRKYPNTLMIGDGVNDTLAMSSSEISIAIKGSAEIALVSSDIFFLRSGLNPLIDLLQINKSIHQTLKRNLTLSLSYNAIAGTLAVLGYINPLWAAVLMPVSSLIILLSTLWGFRQ
jgi:Cu2+-exporting ATPase/Cu+-exporting ATPase